jgi:uncharacterized membrane protein (Fun14 family)
MAPDKDLSPSDPVPGTAPRWRFRLIVVLFGLVVAAVVLRAARGTQEPETAAAAAGGSAQPGGMTTSLTPGSSQPGTEPQPEKPPSTLDTVLPFVTEGGIAMILGLILGMLTRSFLKMLLVFAILGFIGIQYLNYKGIMTVDWGAMKDFVLNMVPRGASLSEIVMKKLPSLGAFGLGYILGLKRG